jgi:DNA helicase-2/ATP-dependent DNA helicase PcrA
MTTSLELNPEQLEAVEHVEGPLLVLAGAGSGKTRVVILRILRLIEKGILPKDILAVTFTNKAAYEMQKRIQEISSYPVTACTFHSLGARFLREFISVYGYGRDFTIYDGEDSLQMIKRSMQELHIQEEKSLSKTIKVLISNAKNDLVEPQDVKIPLFASPEEKAFKDVYPVYQKKLKECNAVDFDDLLFLPVKILQGSQEIRSIYQKRYSFILIDEYQDTNMAQYTLAKILSASHHNIFVVGDPDQSIYSFRGAKFQNILNFDKDFPNAKIVKLERNYRSTDILLKASNALIAHNEERYPKNLWSNWKEEEKIKVFSAYDEEAEADFIIEKIVQHKREHKIPLKDIVVFYRTNSQSRVFEDLLLAQKIPYIIYGGLSFYQRREIKDLMSYLRMLVYNFDALSFQRTILTPKKGIGQTTLEKILIDAQKKQTPLLQYCYELTQNSHSEEVSLTSKQKLSLKDYVDKFLVIKNTLLSKKSLFDIVSFILEEFHYWDYLKEDKETFEDRKENILELLTKCTGWQEKNPNGTLENFLEEISLITSTEDNKEDSSIKLMTLHNGKGLEFMVVFIVGLEEDLLPHMNAKNSDQEIEEERRLCYVGMTRAKKYLYLSHATLRHLWGGVRMMTPSRFLREIPKEFIQYVFNKREASFSEEMQEFEIHNRVYHQVFGAGTIMKKSSTDLGILYDVRFDEDSMIKTLVAKYAKLRPFVE